MTSDFMSLIRERFSFFDRLLIVTIIFFIMFMATSLTLPIINTLLGHSTRASLLTASVVQCLLAFIIPALLSARIAFGRPMHFLALDIPPTAKGIGGIIAVFVLSMPAMNQLIYWNANIIFPEALSSMEHMMRSMENKAAEMTATMLSSDTLTGLIIEILIVGVLTGFAEELFFRGTIQRAGAYRGANHTAIWVTALLFSAIHFQAFGFLPRLLMGAWFGYILYWTGSIYMAAFAHILNNTVVVVSTWISHRYDLQSNTEAVGVAQTGFPVMAFVSALATLAFIYLLRHRLGHPQPSEK